MLHLSIKDPAVLAKICHALSSELRINILALLQNSTMSCLELSKALGYPLSTISTNVKVLEEAGLVLTELLPAKNGSKKLCSHVYLDVLIQLSEGITIPENTMRYEKEIPIGNYMDYQVAPSCGYVTPDCVDDNHFDEPNCFLEPQRIEAGLLWFRHGYVEYRVPMDYWLQLDIQSILFSLEICSEAPGFNNTFKSDITMWINGVEIGTWLSPGDFGDRQGKLTPLGWEGGTQYGLLTEWKVTEENTTVNGTQISSVTINELKLQNKPYVTMRLGVKDNAKNIGGVNIFGKTFGDYPQDIKMCLRYSNQSQAGSVKKTGKP